VLVLPFLTFLDLATCFAKIRLYFGTPSLVNFTDLKAWSTGGYYQVVANLYQGK
jgi:hypothetical protein